MNFSGKEGHPNIQPSTRPGIEPGTSGLGGRDLNHCANPSASELCAHLLAKTVPAREEIRFEPRSKVILQHPSRMFNRILTQFLQRFFFSLHFSRARKKALLSRYSTPKRARQKWKRRTTRKPWVRQMNGTRATRHITPYVLWTAPLLQKVKCLSPPPHPHRVSSLLMSPTC